jgi:hypothetical protein
MAPSLRVYAAFEAAIIRFAASQVGSRSRRRDRRFRARRGPAPARRALQVRQAADIPGMDDGIAAGKCRERLWPQQTMGIGNRANGSHHARPERSRVRREPML